MAIEIRVETTSEHLAGEVVEGDRVYRFVGWLGLIRALSRLIPEPREAWTQTPPEP